MQPAQRPAVTDRAEAAAMESMDQLLADRPHRSADNFSAATRRLCALRDELISAWRRTGDLADRDRLARVNGVISVVVGGHYPLGDIPWDSIDKARKELDRVVRR